MIRSVQRLFFFGLLVLALPAAAQVAQLRDARMSATSNKTRVVFDLSADTAPNIFMVDHPLRLVIDLPHTRSTGSVAGQARGSGLIDEIRTGVHKGTGVRVVLDLSARVQARSFMLSPSNGRRYRLVLDLYPSNGTPASLLADGNGDGAAASGELAAGDDSQTTADKSAAAMAQASSSARADSNAGQAASGDGSRALPEGARARDIVVAIDPGHGGKDPGAHGPDGLLEKNVTLAIARRLKRMVDDQPHMRAVLTRRGDYYVGLRQRMVIARRDKADFFISIHCDASPAGGGATGASVYALSPHGATSEHARWLARRENSADMVGGVSLKDKNSSLASFVLDLSQSQSIEASMDAGQRVLAQLDDLGSLHKSRVQQAGFMVLKSPDIPSILVETNFISNRATEHRLARAGYQNGLAAAMLRGIKGYFASYRPSTYIAADQQHRVKRGDTLSQIAQTYGVSVPALRRYNDMNSNRLQAGQTLKIPPPQAQQLASRS
ncbi:N-acetylmuramoyl-L-alanine amidase [Salinisphaera sp. LB1]|uniref:N-acetylmuramoyl-L-alanine amidase n=1 Tax=Salinisphaera sp. LB1 TaxID=2183911 RepID=UPI000D705AA3|nr:N-acetylmuramoyl-L-alanine amidase [Salinisphaera sp. LB1]AWN16919.1 N-acetylmuramoyl-L-alanine amidase [Salinisphaera sp. LB1]